MPAFRFFCAALLLFLNAGAAYAAITTTDDAGITIQMPAPAQRIITLAPFLAELVYAVGAGAHLIATDSASDYPQAATTLPKIGDASRIDFDRILTLHPDLVIAWKSGNHPADIERLRQMHILVYVAEPEHLTDIPRTMQNIAVLAGTTDKANAGIANFNNTLAQLQQQYATKKPVRVFYEIWHMPLMTVNGQHMISDVIRLCGGVNVFANVPVLTPTVSLESVIVANPDVIVGSDLALANAPKTPALGNVPTIAIPADFIERQTPRVLEGAREICERLDRIRELGE